MKKKLDKNSEAELPKNEEIKGGVLKDRTIKKVFQKSEKSGDPDNGIHKGGVLRRHPMARRKIG